jgi:delta 1-pyrroline-5-carboxylate dehydrogenase
MQGELIMSRVVTALFAGVIATALVGGTAFMPKPAEAAKMSAADKAALKQKTADCKKQAKDQKLKILASRKFVKECVAKK